MFVMITNVYRLLGMLLWGFVMVARVVWHVAMGFVMVARIVRLIAMLLWGFVTITRIVRLLGWFLGS